MQVYVCGGVNFENTDTITDCAAYDPVTKEWDESIDDMPTGMGRNHAASCTDGTSFYILGGRDGKNIVGEGYPDTQIYTPGIGWSTGAPMPLGRGGTGKGVFHDGKCYVFGGEVWEEISPSTDIKVNAERTVYSVDIYDIASNTWSQGKVRAPFPIRKSHFRESASCSLAPCQQYTTDGVSCNSELQHNASHCTFYVWQVTTCLPETAGI